MRLARAIASCSPAGSRACRGLALAGVFALYTRPGLPRDAGRPDLGLLLNHARVDAPSPWIVRWAHLLAPGGTRARRRLRQRPPHALVRRARPSRSPASTATPRRWRRCGALGRGASSPTSRTAPGRFAGRSFDAVVVTNYLWRPLLPDIVAARRAGRRAALRNLRRRQRDRRQAVAARLPAAPRRTARRLPRVCASWPTKTAS